MSTANIDAERALIGAVMIRRGEVAAATFRRFAEVVGAEDFSDPGCADVWRALGRVIVAGRPIDLATVCAELADAGRLNALNGREGLRRLVATSELATACETHAEIVRDCGARRRAIEAAEAHQVRVLGGEDVAASLDRLQTESREGLRQRRDLSMRAALGAAWDELSDETSRNARWGLATLDGDGTRPGLLGGLYGGQLTALGAVPGGGKTALAAQAAVATAQTGGRVLFAALEMPREDLAWRMTAGFCRHHPPSVDRIRSRSLNDYEIADLQRASHSLADLPLLIDDAPTTADAFVAMARAEHSRAPLSLVVVDYLHLFQRDATDAKRREDEVIRRHVYALKTLAKQCRVPVLMLVQFNRTGAKSDRPTMFDAFGGSGIEQGADNVVILVPEKGAKGATRRVTVFVDKRRGGSPMEEGVPVVFDLARQRMRDPDEMEPRDTRGDFDDDAPDFGTPSYGDAE